MKINFKQAFFWFLPIVLCLGFEYGLTDFRGYNIRNFVENTSFAVCLLLLFSLLNRFRWKTKFVKLSYALFVLSLFIESSFYYLFSTYFSASSIFILLETNTAESKEFIEMYFTIHLLWFLILHLGFIFFYFKTKYQPTLVFKIRILPIYKIVALIALISGMEITGLTMANFPNQFISGMVGYVYEVQKYKELKVDAPIGDFQKVEFQGDDTGHTFVLIIGESTNRRQFGLYNFYRETTPILSQRASELLIYQDVISSEAHTIPSLQAALSLNNFTKETESTLVQLMNQAGFKTFWLSNQRPIGMYATLLTKLSKASDVYTYTNTSRWGSFTPFDEVLLPHLDKALKDKAQNKFIVINLLATHGQYKLRYPDKFKKFSDTPETKFPSEANFQTINDYHNAISYVDFVVNEIIEKVNAKNEKSYVLYFSDHGEEVFDEHDFFGHNDSDIPTKAMFEIPFLVWLSPAYKSSYPLSYAPKRPYVLNDFLHSMADLSRIQFEEYIPEKSIFSAEFQPKPRIITQGIDFDTYFKNQK